MQPSRGKLSHYWLQEDSATEAWGTLQNDLQQPLPGCHSPDTAMSLCVQVCCMSFPAMRGVWQVRALSMPSGRGLTTTVGMSSMSSSGTPLQVTCIRALPF